jgi:hypothetical protein
VRITLRRSQAFVSLGGPSADDDFDVMDGETRIGRIYFQPSTAQPWPWSLSQRLAAEKRGRADSRASALQGLIEAYAAIQEFGEALRQSRVAPLGRFPDGTRTISPQYLTAP